MPKKHHYVPVTYLRKFADATGQILVYRKDEPNRPFRQRPESTGFERYYYSQIDSDGVRDDNRFEVLFSQVEMHWSNVVEALARREPMFPSAPRIIEFLGLMRVRGPAFRDAAELHLANVVHAEALMLHAAGKLPPLPEGHPDLIHKLQIAIDPQKSLEAMAKGLSVIGELLGSLSYDVLHNGTDTCFLTSDNPVIYFDPDIPDARMQPYTIRPPKGRVQLLFPVSPTMMLRGRDRPRRSEIGHKDLADRRIVKRMNRLIARFAYRTIFAFAPGAEAIIEPNAALSPVVRFDRIPTASGGFGLYNQFIFGPRPAKPKW